MPDSPRITDLKRAEKAARSERLARSLRDNLRRRKEQARERAEGPPLPSPTGRDGGDGPPA